MSRFLIFSFKYKICKRLPTPDKFAVLLFPDFATDFYETFHIYQIRRYKINLCGCYFWPFLFHIRSPLPGACNSFNKPLQRHFYRPVYLNNRVFLSRNYRLRVAPREFDVLKTKNMLVLRTSNFQGATIRPTVPRHKHYCLYCSPLNFLPHVNSKLN